MPYIEKLSDSELIILARVRLSDSELLSSVYHENGKFSSYDYDISTHTYSTGDQGWKLQIMFDSWQDARDFKDLIREILHRYDKLTVFQKGNLN